MKRRLFIALEIPNDIRESLKTTVSNIAASIPGKLRNFHWEEKDNYHITLKFIGETEDTLIEAINSDLNFLNVRKGFSGFINHFGVFPNPRAPKLLWAGLEIQPDMTDIVKEINEKLYRIGIKKENKKFKPHITLLRIKENCDISFVNYFFSYKLEKEIFPLNKIVLYESKLNKSGSEYKSLENYQLI